MSEDFCSICGVLVKAGHCCGNFSNKNTGVTEDKESNETPNDEEKENEKKQNT